MSEKINHPDHYQAVGYEAIDIIEAYGLNFAFGSSLKYILTARRKPNEPAIDDLPKAIRYHHRDTPRVTKDNP